MKVGVFAGTAIDTEMGAKILIDEGFTPCSYPMAKNPKEQTELQYFSKDELEKLFRNKVIDAKSNGSEKIFIYCNSLSSAIDYNKISIQEDIPIITPLETYENLPKSSKSIVILAANAISSYMIDKIIKKSRPDIKTISIGNLSIVESIEEKLSSEKIIENLNLNSLINYIENIKDERYRVDTIILGCTHFPYIKSALEKYTSIKILDPKDDMIKRLKSNTK